MTICVLGNNLTALTLAKALVNNEIDVELLFNKQNYKINNSRTIGITKKSVPDIKYKIVKKLFSIIKKKSFVLIILIPVIIKVNGIK